ncbi:hypothetical protein MSAN_01791200 [Mycena sanguinolenta]|uniref:Uncharacterized protein n=1 Tax=Mycena sanguinolenta TaxID=230812 RepID=A0A8H7CU73_9AGAR|nr:hypothetical protein MSAN_01791200 [Mycena sanguinolenta]
MSCAVSETNWTFVFSLTIKSAAALFLNGICIVLALQASYFLNRRTSSGRGVLIWAMGVACAFSILQMGYQVGFTVKFVRLQLAAELSETADQQKRLQDSFQHLTQVKAQWDGVVLLLNNFASDCLFIYRCYTIWGHSRYKRQIISIPVILLLFTTILGVTFIALPGASLSHIVVVGFGAIVTNIFLTGLTTGRIWWTRRQLCVVGETKLTQQFNTAIGLLLESSAVYVVVFATFLFAEIRSGGRAAVQSTGISIICGASGQLLNILPALAIVRVSFARTVDVDPGADRMVV